ncbi:hypothetical protein BBO99_00002659 [Phytophthora kernoviae]|uniref:Uncharacterized protein n=2 Tax=Phytophthora kernoviae TaxID=325452 RepID=A0A421GWK6_9STRA|nr:hypothetical protein G195_004543 [Phytophthora kernoviae 00238/432]KAG2526935.1 hypothetical protein JM16_002755 [Phytophthora kernoviae]KAG2528444.1 hypothetical protein JM18_002633 [Phytophthora kernoviae]RLN14145.1 hypothetical protein BBI17_002603 [Phytophthora kernoviae]RLN82777.1 hypothetical protein BBO99_00002659 [Phytophthora kernoviae]
MTRSFSDSADDDPGTDGAQLWAALRAFSDAELQCTKNSIRQYHFAHESGLLSPSVALEPGPKNSIQVQLNGGKQHVRVDDFVHVFLDYLHRQVQLHADEHGSGDPTDATASETDSSTNMATLGICNGVHPSDNSNSTPESTIPSCEAPSEFCWRVHCLDFAELVFEEIEEVLAHLGSDLLGLVKQSLCGVGDICTAMVERLGRVSQRREELRVAESARIGCQLPIEMKASAVRDFALPFCEETDSRLHYRTPAESLLYSNREKVRDGFLSLLRQFQQKQHSLVGIENAGVAAAAIASARELLAEVSPENRWWFAKFFVLELVQVGSNPFGESDKDLVLKIMEDKLVDTRAASNEDDATKNFTATFDRMRGFFSDNQLFFFHFLHSCDSYEFSELVKHQLERQFYAIRDTTSPSADARKDFTEVVLRLKVVAKFLGYLRFSPQWQVTSSIRRLSAQNAAFKAVEREGISTLEIARDSSLDWIVVLWKVGSLLPDEALWGQLKIPMSTLPHALHSTC